MTKSLLICNTALEVVKVFVVIVPPDICPVAVMVEVDDILFPLIFPKDAVMFPLYDSKLPYADMFPIDDVILPKVDVMFP